MLNEDESVDEVKSAAQLNERTWTKMNFRNVSVTFMSHSKSGGRLKGLISKVFQQFNCVFGYLVTGNLDSINETKIHCGLIRDEDLNKALEQFWKVEEVEKPIIKNKERLICEEHYANTHFRTKEVKYVVFMPLKEEPSCLGNSKGIALKRLGSMWNRLARDENYLNSYREFLRDYEKLGHMKKVTNEMEPKITYYATHHGIYHPEKSTTKFVFNCCL
ncbi:uncharacterized protein TNCV_2484891 [Trichonephila clavipes]|uniref:Uncharacterized protein n=1 Tax=Trichonephila clavipes TaxID=2585209 RepID=A0A8X7BC68_TRICX|nr:uncharacterized protein TNCV_2484891 [Trichonephila clavipes]